MPFFPKVRVATCYLSQDIPTLGPLDDPHAVLTHALTDMQYDLLDSTRERDLTRP